jgi:hypothetical protein
MGAVVGSKFTSQDEIALERNLKQLLGIYYMQKLETRFENLIQAYRQLEELNKRATEYLEYMVKPT